MDLAVRRSTSAICDSSGDVTDSYYWIDRAHIAAAPARKVPSAEINGSLSAPSTERLTWSNFDRNPF